MIKFDGNDQIKIFVVCLLPFTGFKTATTVTPKILFRILDTKQRVKASLNLSYGSILSRPTLPKLVKK